MEPKLNVPKEVGSEGSVGLGRGRDILVASKMEKKKEAGRKRGFWSEDATLRSVALEVVPLPVTTESKV